MNDYSGLIGAMNATSQNLNSLAAGIAANNLNADNRKWQEDVMWLQRQWQKDDWNKNADYQRELLNQAQNWDAAEWTRRFDYEAAYNKEVRDYNSPAAQMRRLRQAGINPFYAMQSIANGNDTASVGNSSPGISIPGSPSQSNLASVPNVYTQNPFEKFRFGESFGNFASTVLGQEEIRSRELANQKSELENFLLLGSIPEQLDKMGMENREKRAMMPYLEQMIELNLRQSNANLENSYANTASLYTAMQKARDEVTLMKNKFALEKAIQEWNVERYKKLDAAQVQLLGAQAAEYFSRIPLNAQLTDQAKWLGFKAHMEGLGVKLDNDLKDVLMPYTYNLGVQTSLGKELENEYLGKSMPNVYTRYIQPSIGDLIRGVGTGAGIWLGLKGYGFPKF